MIKKGLFAIDNYTKFGGMLDTLEQAGTHLFIYSPKKETVTAVCKKDRIEAIKKVAGGRVMKVKVHGGIAYITIRV